MKKTYLKKMGLEPVEKLNMKICRAMVSFLKKKIKAHKFEGKLLEKAKYYANWYAWMAEKEVPGDRRRPLEKHPNDCSAEWPDHVPGRAPKKHLH